MNHRARRIVETAACERRYGIADAKGAEYSGKGSTYKEDGADTLHNFKSVAERIGGTPEQVLMTYLLKHVDSINTAVKEAAGCGSEENWADQPGETPRDEYAKGEGIVSRMDDARNYLDLLECLLIDNGHIEASITEWVNPEPKAYPLVSPDKVREAQQAAFATCFGDKYIEPPTHDVGDLIPGTQCPCGLELCKHHPLPNDPNGATWESSVALSTDEKDSLERAGLVEGLDGVWRGATTIHESVRNPGERQVPIFAQPTQDSVRGEDVTSTGELA